MNLLKNQKDVINYLTAGTIEQAKRNLYKATVCGAWIDFQEQGIELGSIVEGSDCEVSTDPLFYPFAQEDFERTIAYIEEEAETLWNEANREEEEE